MNYDGEKFLLKLYKELYNEESVKHSSTKSDNKYEAVKKYIERLEKVHEKAMNHKTDTGVNLLKDFYYDKYVIKKDDIPESYMEYLDKVQFDQYGIYMDDWQKEEQKNLIIEDQKKSLDEWLDYFMSEDAKFYPTWAKYWAFQGMLTIGNFDTNKGIYNKRSKTTVAPFPELDREILSKSIDLVIKEVNKEEINDKDLEQLVKNGNFFKLYTVQLKDTRKSNFSEDTKGEWIKYEQGDNYQELYKSLQGKNTGWCTAGEETCKLQVKYGDFYVYYTYDEKGKATIPRLAIRMDGKNIIGEIRGVGKDQNIEPHFEDILSKKLKGFPDAESYQKRVKDTQMLTYVYTKYENHKPLTKEDIKFIYEIDNEIETMGWEMDPRLEEMQKNEKERKIKDVLDSDDIIELVKKNNLILTFIPKKMIDKKVALGLAKQNEYTTLQFIPKEIIDKEIALELVKQNEYTALQFVPKEIIDKEIALELVKRYTIGLQYVPKEVIDREIVLEAVKQTGVALQYVPENMKDKEVCLEAVKQEGKALQYVPKEVIDREIVLEALRQTGIALQYVPENMKDKEICLVAAKQEGKALQHVPKDVMDREICLEAVKQTGIALQYVPENIMDKEICLVAVKQTWGAIEFVPDKLEDKDILLEVVKQNGEFLCYTFSNLEEINDLIDFSVFMNERTKYGYSEEIIDKEVCLAAVKQAGKALRYVPYDMIDKEICLAAVKQNGLALECVPYNMIDKEICLAAVKQAGKALQYRVMCTMPDEVIEEVNQAFESMKNNDEDTVQVLENSDSKMR